MWIEIKPKQEINSHLLNALLAQLRQRPQPIMFSFQIKNEPQVIYLINNETSKLYSSKLIADAINIKMWQWQI